ncbi:hypothetical protein VU02_03095 [Desulfobulbus sp. N2]|nr:hypothetical protein [Desulfobulbus sp. N2]
MSGLTFETEFDWDDFCRYLTYENRHVLTEKWLRFVSVILATAVERQEVIDIGKTFFRARIGKENQLVVESHDEQGCFNGYKLQPFSEEKIGAPPPGMAGAGRLNPEGISYLYLSNKVRLCERSEPQSEPFVGQARHYIENIFFG